MTADTIDSALMKAHAATFARQASVVLVGYEDAETSADGLKRVFAACWGEPRPGLQAVDGDGRRLAYIVVERESIYAALRFARLVALNGDRVEPRPRRPQRFTTGR